MKKVIIIIGAPGSGKGTQADLIAEKFNCFHFDTGRFLESLFYFNENIENDPELQAEKKLFDEGKLVSPPFVLKMMKKKVKEFSANGTSLVFSGSPRTMYEAFDDGEGGLIDVLEQEYGKENIVALEFLSSPEASIARNGSRMVCSVCKKPILGVLNLHIDRCPFCGGALRKRSLDDPEVIKVRLEEFKNRTFPILEELKKRGYVLNEIDANPMPYEVFEFISKILQAQFQTASSLN